eukprot:evm.model.scf_2709.4 EVM.evm.TU.scf_2709.4   scf_2709:15621-19190(-)
MDPDCRAWPAADDLVIVQVVAVELDEAALACQEVQSVIVVQSFLDDFCPVELQSSSPSPKARGPMALGHAVGYRLLGKARAAVEGMVAGGACRVYLGVVSQIEGHPAGGDASRVSMESGGGVKYLDIGMVEVDLLQLSLAGAQMDRATLTIASSDKYRRLTGMSTLGTLTLTVHSVDALAKMAQRKR